jgi:diguanylate cyclase (GGDEF)-like protein
MTAARHDRHPAERPLVLVVDDSPVQIDLLDLSLSRGGYTVIRAASGAEAVEAARTSLPDAVVSDVLMPGMDGFDLCRRIRGDAATRSIPVILVTALDEPEDVLRGAECGASGFVGKPYEAGFLLSQVADAIEHHSGAMRLPPSVAADPARTLALALSAYANAVAQNTILLSAREDLRRANEDLEERVRERTAELDAEVAVRRAAEEQLRYLANHDYVTGLPNRRMFAAALEHASARAVRAGTSGALLMIDLDGFKSVNDDFGHEAGDTVLAEIGRRLGAQIRSCDTAARVGGDEFAVVLETVADAAAAEVVAARIVARLREPIRAGAGSAVVGASVGIAVFPDDGTGVDELMAHGDAAMYGVKHGGKSAAARWRRPAGA